MGRAGWIGRILAAARVDLQAPTTGPPLPQVAVATAAALAVSLGANALLVRAGTAVFPSTAGYTHFRFSDYAPLTALGVVAAGAAWWVTTRATSVPRWLFLRLAVVVTLVLLAPDAWLLAKGQPADAVAVLVVMHLAVTLVTYNLLVRVAPVGGPGEPTAPPAGPEVGSSHLPAALEVGSSPPRAGLRAVWLTLASLVGAEAVLGVAALAAVPYDRPDAWVPTAGRAVYLVHAGTGGILGLLGVAMLVAATGRTERMSALAGVVGVAVGAGGGILAVHESSRLLGMGLMLLGSVVAGFAYLVPVGLAEPDGPGGTTAETATGGAGAGEMACFRCRSLAADARRRASVSNEEWAAACIRAGTCPMCPGRRLQQTTGVARCRCCGTTYRELPDEDGAAWIVTPGRGVAPTKAG